MPKAQVLVTITAEALVDVPADVQDVEGFIRQNVGLAWGGLELASVVQTPGITLDYFVVPEPEPVQEAIVEPEPVAFDAESTIESATEESVVDVAETVASSDTAHVEAARVAALCRKGYPVPSGQRGRNSFNRNGRRRRRVGILHERR